MAAGLLAAQIEASGSGESRVTADSRIVTDEELEFLRGYYKSFAERVAPLVKESAGFAALIEQGNVRAARACNVRCCGLRGLQERAVRPASTSTNEADALGLGIGGHLQHERNIHRLSVGGGQRLRVLGLQRNAGDRKRALSRLHA